MFSFTLKRQRCGQPNSVAESGVRAVDVDTASTSAGDGDASVSSLASDGRRRPRPTAWSRSMHTSRELKKVRGGVGVFICSSHSFDFTPKISCRLFVSSFDPMPNISCRVSHRLVLVR